MSSHIKNIRVVDSHVHLWDRDKMKYSWTDSNPVLARNYFIGDFNNATKNINLEAFVFVEAGMDARGKDLREVEWVIKHAEQNKLLSAIVADVPLENEVDRVDVLNTLKLLKLVTGIRRITQGKPSGFMKSPVFISGVKMAHDYGFSVDICVHSGQLEEVAEMISACPTDVKFVLDHVGKPGIARGEIEPWKSNLERISRNKNVWCKLSGMVTEANPDSWKIEELKPYVDHVIICFGVERIMFGSDWPVCLVGATYEKWVETVHSLISHLPETDIQKIFSENAKKFYINRQ